MCLDTVTERFRGKKSRVRVKAWKVFVKNEGKRRGLGPLFKRSWERFAIGKWHGAVVRTIMLGENSYRSGFHAWLYEEAALEQARVSPHRVVRQVLLTGVICTGSQDPLNRNFGMLASAIVAKKMKILKLRKKKEGSK